MNHINTDRLKERRKIFTSRNCDSEKRTETGRRTLIVKFLVSDKIQPVYQAVKPYI